MIGALEAPTTQCTRQFTVLKKEKYLIMSRYGLEIICSVIKKWTMKCTKIAFCKTFHWIGSEKASWVAVGQRTLLIYIMLSICYANRRFTLQGLVSRGSDEKFRACD